MGYKLPLPLTNFYGGWATDLKQGTPASFAYSKHLDFYKSPTLLWPFPASTKETGSTVTGLITDMIQLPSGKMVAIDSSGGVYTRTTGGVWAKNGTTLNDTACGLVYNLQQDTVYVPGLTSVHSITNADGRFSGGSFTVNNNAITNQQDQASANGHGNTYSVTGSITETSVNKLSFTPTIEPLYSVKLWVTAKDTADLTVTLHDAANNNLGSVTIVNASLNNGALNEFIFSTPPRMLAKPNPSTYHFHITKNTGSPTVGTSTSSDFSTADYRTMSNRLVSPNNGFHPIYEFLQYYLILNERYLAVWEPISQSAPSATEFNQHRLTFPAGYEGTSGAIWTDYFVVATEKRSTSATNEFQSGKLFLWDGTSTTYNLVIDVPEGAPYGLFSHKNVLYYFAGGSWWAWSGSQPVKLFQMPNTDFDFDATNRYLINYPHTITVRNSILHAGFPSETNSTTIEHAVYTFGSRNKNYPNAFGYGYSISTGNNKNGTLRLGMVKSFGDKMFIAWRDGSNYGVDKVDPNSAPFASGSWEGLITDVQFYGGHSRRGRISRPDVDKSSPKLKIVFTALPSGATVTAKYKRNRAAGWTSGTPATAGATEAVVNINKRYREMQFGFDFTCGSTPFQVIGVIPIVDGLGEEAD